MSDTAWLQALQVGEKVIVREGAVRRHDRPATVARLTKNLVVIGTPPQERRFLRKDGWEAGYSKERYRYSQGHLEQWTKATADALSLERLRDALHDELRSIRRTDLGKLTADQCAQFLALLTGLGLREEKHDG